MRLAIACLTVLLVASPAAAQEPQPQERMQREHVVREGDTLWDLAGFYLSNPFSWPVIHEANPLVVEDPHWIYPQEVLIIPGAVAAAPAGAPAAPVVANPRTARTTFYREPVVTSQDRGPTLLSEPGLTDVPVKPGQFYSAEFLEHPDRLRVVGRMIRTLRNVGDRNDEPTTAQPRDLIFLSYAPGEQPRVGDRLVMVDATRSVPEAGRGTRIIRPTAIVRVETLNEEVMEARVEHQFRAVDTNQAAIPIDLYPDLMASEAAPVQGADLQGELFEMVTEQVLYGKTDRGFIDLGRRDGVQVGDIFVAYLPEREVDDAGDEYARFGQDLPPETVAELIVVRVDEATSTVQIRELVLPVVEEGMLVHRIRKMP